ncbi:MAG TPA: hypothetical protein VII10_19750 [Reyranella sp.]
MERQQADQRDLAGRRQQHGQRRALGKEAGAHDARGDRSRKSAEADRESQQRATEGEPADGAHRDRRDEGVAVDQRRQRREGAVIQPHRAQAHGDEGDGHGDQQRDPGTPRLAVDGVRGKLSGDLTGDTEAFDGATFGVGRWPGRIGLGGVAQMVFDFAGKASRQRRIEIKLAPQRSDILFDHAGHARPPSSVSTAREKRPHTLRRSASAAEPALVSE